MKKISKQTLCKLALVTNQTFENLTTEKEIREIFDELNPIINKDGNYEFLITSEEDPVCGVFLVITSNDVIIECQSDFDYAKLSMKNCLTKKWLLDKFKKI